jgi:hypothetical protein
MPSWLAIGQVLIARPGHFFKWTSEAPSLAIRNHFTASDPLIRHLPGLTAEAE